MGRLIEIAIGASSPHTVVTVSGNQILVDGTARKLYGVRTASATYDQTKTDHLIAQLDDYKAHGIRAAAVYFQGSSGANYNPFNTTGTDWTDGGGHLARMQQIAQALLDRDMVLVCGIFYVSGPWSSTTSPTQLDAFTEAAKLVTAGMSAYPNVILNIANECNHPGWSDFFISTGLPNTQAIAAAMHAISPDAIIGTGGWTPLHNGDIADLADIDVVLSDTDNLQPCGGPYDAMVNTYGVTKPILNVETFGPQSKAWPEPPGVYTTTNRNVYIADVDDCTTRETATFFFDGRWMQPLSISGGGYTADDMRYDMATPGDGTETNPGFRWWGEHVRDNGDPW